MKTEYVPTNSNTYDVPVFRNVPERLPCSKSVPVPPSIGGTGRKRAEIRPKGFALTMPHPTCSCCTHEACQVIDSMLKSGESMRVIAKRFGLSSAAVHRHANHSKHAETRKNIGQIAHIDEEIRKLTRAQNKAKRRRDSAGSLAIARELRAWFVLRTKAEIAAIGTQDNKESEQLSPIEAVTLAKNVIEARLSDPEVRNWLAALNERIGIVSGAPDQDSTDSTEE